MRLKVESQDKPFSIYHFSLQAHLWAVKIKLLLQIKISKPWPGWKSYRTDGLMDAEAGVEQVEERMLSVNLSEWCVIQVRPEKCKRTTLSWQQITGHDVSLISNRKTLLSEKSWIWLWQMTDALSLSHPTEKPCVSHTVRKRWETTDFQKVWHNTQSRKVLLNNTTADTHLQSTNRVTRYTCLQWYVVW